MKLSSCARLRMGCAGVALLTLSACGGGGSGSIASTPPPPSAPPVGSNTGQPDDGDNSNSGTDTTTPPPTTTEPSTVDYDTSEYRRSDGAVYHNAISAWESGANGEGVAVAVIDSGIDGDSPEFAGRIHQDSTDVVSNRGIDNPDGGHGTHVSLVIAGARDDTGVVGIAWNAQILSLRADTPGSCAQNASCTFSDASIAAGIDQAVASGARVINLSLGGSAPAPDLRRAVADAARAGVVVVVAAGNEGGRQGAGVDPDAPTAFASGLMQSGDGHVIIVGSVDENGVISDFSNRAGYAEDGFITARGERICCEYEDGALREVNENGGSSVWLISGTSYAAPQVSGAAALLAQAFPNLTGREIVQILLASAADVGDEGVDVVYGHGVLDIAAAFAPQGQATIAGTGISYSPGKSQGQSSGAMGDAVSGASLPALMTDGYDRAYNIDLAQGLSSAPIARKLTSALTSRSRHHSLRKGKTALAFTLAPQSQLSDNPAASQADPRFGAYALSPTRLRDSDANKARLLAARASFAISQDTDLAFALGVDGKDLMSGLQDEQRPAFLLSGDEGAFGSVSRQEGKLAFAMRRKVGKWGLSFGADTAKVQDIPLNDLDTLASLEQAPSTLRRFSIGADRRLGPVTATLGLSWLKENSSVLGARLAGPWANPGASSLIADLAASWQIAPQWQVNGAWQQGRSQVERTGLIQAGSQLTSQSWSLDIEHLGVLSTDGRLGFRISQPLRVSGGGLNLRLPTSYDYASESANFSTSFLSLAPTGREQRAELRWSGSVLGGYAGASLFWRQEPGHYNDAPDDAGLAMQWQREF